MSDPVAQDLPRPGRLVTRARAQWYAVLELGPSDPASLAIDRAVGYTVTKRWLTYAPGGSA